MTESDWIGTGLALDCTLIVLDSTGLWTGSALDQHWIDEILAAAGRAADWIGTGSVLDRSWIFTGSDWIGLDSRSSPVEDPYNVAVG